MFRLEITNCRGEKSYSPVEFGSLKEAESAEKVVKAALKETESVNIVTKGQSSLC